MLKYSINIVILFAGIMLATTVGWGAGDPFEPWGFGGLAVSEGSSSFVADKAGSNTHRENVSLPARLALGGLNFFS
ncbi:MAG: hypothetical protein PHY29_11605, partial [Syntrophales bacterium]|nr:hypothetical protein [Syntrophales bacterium]